MEIEFQFEDNKHILIIGVLDTSGRKSKHEIGRIFTPAGSGEDTTNAIQVCGFTEAFDLWGCGKYALAGLDSSGNFFSGRAEQTKDIQLKFQWETVRHDTKLDGCLKCFNDPCTCEVKAKYTCPYTVKCSTNLGLQKVK